MDPSAPIGIFDSGLGGLSVLREVRQQLPAEDVVYYADNAYCPYGSRTAEEIQARSEAIAAALLAEGAKAVVVACNTASSVAITHLRARFDIPFIGLEPAVKPAVQLTRSGKVAVLATPRTVTGERLRRLIHAYAREIDVVTVPAPGLVELVETGTLSGEQVQLALRPLLEPLLARGVDTIVLGCTHYPFLRREIEAFVGPTIAVIDSGAAIARRTREVLLQHGALQDRPQRGELQLMTSGAPETVGAIATSLIGEPVLPLALAV
ncbi:MAG: glutamate racemase [Chloroflexota bacterium]|nr:glutamate racemase [Chloroflexota bacterium]